MQDWFDDFDRWLTDPEPLMTKAGTSESWNEYSRAQVENLASEIFAILKTFHESEKIAAGASPLQSISATAALKTVFLSHGRSKDWLEVQPYIEKDLKVGTIEFEQSAIIGQTVIEALENLSSKCDSAVIVMTGDDIDPDGKPHARENVMHEIGWFQGAYKRHRVALLHEEGVNIPSNLSGLIYVPYTKGNLGGALPKLARFLKKLYD